MFKSLHNVHIKKGHKKSIFHGYIFNHTDGIMIAISMVVAPESAAKFRHLYQSNSNREGQKSEATSFKWSKVIKERHPVASKTKSVWQFVIVV